MNGPSLTASDALALAKLYQDAAHSFWLQSRDIAEKGSAAKAAKYEQYARTNYAVARHLMRVEVLS